MSATKQKVSIDRRQIVLVIIIILALYVLIPQISSFHKSWGLLRNVNIGWTVLAICLTLATYYFAALTYIFLSLYKLRYMEVVIVQYAAMLVNRLLPAGVGALGANYAYLRNKKHNATQAATVIGINNILGLVGHILIIAIVLSFSSGYSRNLAFHYEHKVTFGVWVFFLVVAIAAVLGIIYGRNRFKQNIKTLKNQIILYRKHPLKILGALSSSMMLTLCNILCLYCCMYAIGIHLPFVIVLLIFTLGISTGTVTPTPGGLGGFEAGLFAGFIAFGVDSASALAIALLYRLISYWFAILFGIIAFVDVQKHHLFVSK